MNYLAMNISGYLFYGIYSTLGYFFEFKGAGTVVIADLIFVYHALLMCFILSVQACIYPHGKNVVSKYAVGLCILLWVLVILHIIFSQVRLNLHSFGKFYPKMIILTLSVQWDTVS